MGLRQWIGNMLTKEVTITDENKFYRSFYDYFASEGNLLNRDLSNREYVKEGYEGNIDVYAIVTKIASKFAGVPGRLYDVSGEEKKEITKHPFLDLMNKPNHYQSGYEFKMLWELFRLITGNSIVYVPRIEGGNNAGK